VSSVSAANANGGGTMFTTIINANKLLKSRFVLTLIAFMFLTSIQFFPAFAGHPRKQISFQHKNSSQLWQKVELPTTIFYSTFNPLFVILKVPFVVQSLIFYAERPSHYLPFC